MLPAYRIILADGRSVVASAGHQWLIDGKPNSTGAGHGLRWARTDELAINARIKDLGAPWEQAVHAQSGVMNFAVSGLYNASRFLGSVRPHRLVHNAIDAFDGATPNRVGTARVVSIEYLGERELVTIGTSTRTLFAEGLFSHNSLATTRDQARIVFGDAQAMARKSPGFRGRFKVTVGAHNIHVLETGSKFEALSSEGSTLDGLNIHFGCVDELHAHKTRTVYDVVETGTGKRDNSLLWVITTAGSNRAGICYETRTFVTKLLEGLFEDDSQFGIIYGLDDADDWTSEEALLKANPNWGISVRPEVLLPLQAKAMQMPSAINNFKTKHLNEWVNADTAWMDMRSWEACADPSITEDEFIGEECYVALDLASKVDIAAKAKLFQRDGKFYAFLTYYLPESAAEDGRNSQYSGWARQGLLTLTPGNVTDFDQIEAELMADASRFQI
ncbi:MAG: hypothetical protein GJU76_09950, partial [Gallionella sp.]|nr:hypothetical protein [Gallionella sp.]